MAKTIQSVQRASHMLLYVADHPGSQASEISAHLGLSAPTTHHLLSTLVQEGLLRKDAYRRYELGAASERIAERINNHHRPAAELRFALAELARITGESCYLTAWRGDELRVVAVVEGEHAVRVAGLVVGYTEHVHARAGARVMLAYADPAVRDAVLADYEYTSLTPSTVQSRAKLDAELERIRETGIAHDRGAFRLGVYSISAPIVQEGQVRAALSLTAPDGRFSQHADEYVEALRYCSKLPNRDLTGALSLDAQT